MAHHILSMIIIKASLKRFHRPQVLESPNSNQPKKATSCFQAANLHDMQCMWYESAVGMLSSSTGPQKTSDVSHIWQSFGGLRGDLGGSNS